MKLHLLRHAKTEPASLNQQDFDRNLLQRGQDQILEIGGQIWEELSTDTPVFVSTSNRTMQTLDLLQRDCSFLHVFPRNELYLASHVELLEFLNQIDGNASILMIGHNDGISDLASYLTEQSCYLSTGSFISLDIHVLNWQHLSKGTAHIEKQITPTKKD